MSLVVIVLYFLPYFISSGSIGSSLIITDLGAGLAAATVIFSFVSYLWAPRKYIIPTALFVYLLLAVMTGTLIISTGGPFSSFVSLWLVIGVFASVFGLWGTIPLFLASVGYATYVYLSSTSPSYEALIIIAVTAIVPLIVSYIIFHSRPKSETKGDAAYHQLASELSSVTNKSDVVIRAIDDGVIAINSKGNIELMNPAAQRILGWGNSDALGLDYRSVLKLTDKQDQPPTAANDPVGTVLSTNQDVHTKDFFATTGGGKRIIISLVVSPIGQLGEGVIIVFQDVTRDQAEEREQAEFISTASHEMRTPVASIEGYLGLALNPNTAQIDDKARDFINKAHQSAQHLGRLFQDLLDVTKADDGRLSNHPSVVDVIEYVGEIVEGLKPKAEEKHLRLYYKPLPDGDEVIERRMSPVFYVNVDNDHLREVIANLVENAIKYTPHGDVIVDVNGDEDHVNVHIQDSGIGIPHEDIPHLFQKFYRVDNTATREIGGTGLGLYLCRRLTEVMGGRIWVDSEFQKGSTFHLELPRLEREEAQRLIDAASTKIESEAEQTSQSAFTEEAMSTDPSLDPPTVIAEPLVEPAPTQPPVQPQPLPQETVPEAAPTLAAIEQNPNLYAQNRPQAPIQIPVRDPNNTNQS